jgi:hypothetical protein
MHQDFTLAAVDEKTRRVFPDLCEGLETKVSKLSGGPYNVFAKMLMPALSKAVRKSARVQTSLDAARLACALERYRLARSNLPETLESLAPNFIEKIPTDVIDGKPLRYRRESDDSYIIYSIGWNQTDDAGQIVWSKGTTPDVDTANGDWVWQMPAKRPAN